MHLYLDHAVTLTVLATAALDVEAEPAGFITTDICFRRAGEEFTDWCKHAGVRSRVGAWRPTDGRLIDDDGFVQMIDTFDILVRTWYGLGTMQPG